MRKKQIGGLIIAAVLFIAIGVTSVLTHALTDRFFSSGVEDAMMEVSTFEPPSERYIGVVNVVGTIQEQTETGAFETAEGYQHTSTMEFIDNLAMDDNNAGILLYIDSPGGAVYESEELYDKLAEYSDNTGRPIWAYMAHYAASGGYMAAAATDCIYANKNTVTGSIGVIMSGYDMTGLYEKLGIKYVSITSGANKDSSKLTDEQIAIYQSQVDECYQSFVGIVASGRNMSETEVKALADGRTYTASQALNNGLIDNISSYDVMEEAFCAELDTYTLYEMPQESDLFASLFARVEEVIPKSEAQILTETASKLESGVLMYYADQLQ